MSSHQLEKAKLKIKLVSQRWSSQRQRIEVFVPSCVFLSLAFPKSQGQNGLERNHRLQAQAQEISLFWNGIHSFTLCHFLAEQGSWASRISPWTKGASSLCPPLTCLSYLKQRWPVLTSGLGPSSLARTCFRDGTLILDSWVTKVLNDYTDNKNLIMIETKIIIT